MSHRFRKRNLFSRVGSHRAIPTFILGAVERFVGAVKRFNDPFVLAMAKHWADEVMKQKGARR